MIEIKINYGVDIDVEAPALRRMAAALLVLAGDTAVSVTASTGGKGVHVSRPVGGPVQGNGARATASPVPIDAPYGEGWKIAPNDVPDVGAEIEPDPAAVFGGAVQENPEYVDPAQVFGAGNVAAGLATASSPSAASTVAVLPNLSANGSDAASGDAGNGQGVTSVTPSGTPAVPNSGAVTGGVGVDSRGLPWDGRIHAGTKTTNKDGSWKKKPNVEADLVAQVEAELRAIMAIPSPVPNVPTGAPVTPPVAVVPPPPPASAPVGNVVTPTPPVSAPTTAAGVASNPITGFNHLLPAVTNAISAGTLTEAQVSAALARVGVQVLPQLAPRPDLVAAVAADLFPGR